ncbi:MAG: baseplate J/gp47 family protein [Bacillota bacterium]|nr:baseplate J/gp47 family protein [Bacillota bacterium]
MIDFSQYTFESILQGLLSRIPDDLDKREGSIIYDALAPAAYEFASMYRNLEAAFKESFVATATGENLDQRGAEMGISRRAAVKSVRLGKFYDAQGNGMDVALGSRFATLDGENSRVFVAIAKEDNGVFHLEAEDGGAGANSYWGRLLPVQYIDGLAEAEMVEEPVIAGADEESDEEYRARYLYKVQNEPFDGNCAQYIQWALEYPGIGKCKIFPLWQGPNTVKVSVLNTEDMPCSQQLLADFQEYLDPNAAGLGNGVAPIGAKVTAATVTLLNISISCTVELAAGSNSEHYKALITKAVEDYLKEISYKKNKVFIMEVGAAILSVEGVLGLSELKLNNSAGDVQLGDEECPHLTDLTMEVTT